MKKYKKKTSETGEWVAELGFWLASRYVKRIRGIRRKLEVIKCIRIK
jgi:hypothetical protein